MKEQKADRRYHSVDFIKGVCILFVIITHYTLNTEERLRYLFPFWIDMAVPLLMIISGFVYTKSYLKHGVTSLESAYHPERVISKMVRYTVPFTIAFAIEQIALGFLEANNFNILHMASCFMQGGLGPGSYYYPVMMQFIFFCPMIFMLIYRYDFRGWFICFGLNFLYELLRRVYGMNVECYRLIVFRYILCIASGCYLAISGGGGKNFQKYSALYILTGAAYIILVRYCGVTPLITNYWVETSVWACLYMIPISAVLLTKEKKNRILEALGKASYHIYLVQMVYYYVGASFLYEAFESRILQILGNISICLLGGILFYYAERPISGFVNRKIHAIMKRLVWRKRC